MYTYIYINIYRSRDCEYMRVACPIPAQLCLHPIYTCARASSRRLGTCSWPFSIATCTVRLLSCILFRFAVPHARLLKRIEEKKKEVRLPYPSTNRYFSLNFRHFSTSLVCSYRLYECFVTGVFFFFRLNQWKNYARIKFWEQMIRSLL